MRSTLVGLFLGGGRFNHCANCSTHRFSFQQTAMLLGVCGVNAVCLNYLHTNSEENSRKLRSVIESLMQGKSLGQSVNAVPETDQQRQAGNVRYPN